MEQYQPESSNQKRELLQKFERFVVAGISIFKHKVFCGDEREPLTNEMYLHVFGGAANTAYNTEVLARAKTKGFRAKTYAKAVSAAAKAFKAVSIAAGIHSDTHSEKGAALDPEGEGEIGCGYVKLRRAISRKIADDPAAVVAEAESLRPELFTDPSDTSFGHMIAQSHASLADDDEFFSENSRKVAAAAMEEGAPSMLVAGNHTAREGIINLIAGTTFDSASVNKSGMSSYWHDAWGSSQMAAAYDNAKEFTHKEWEIADTIDAIGTMWALGVETIAVRR